MGLLAIIKALSIKKYLYPTKSDLVKFELMLNYEYHPDACIKQFFGTDLEQDSCMLMDISGMMPTTVFDEVSMVEEFIAVTRLAKFNL